MAADDGVAWRHAQIVERGFAGVRAGPEQRSAVTEEAGAVGDHPHQNQTRAYTCGERSPEAAVGDELFRLGGSGDVESVAGEEFDEGVLTITLGKGGEALGELRKRGFGGFDGAPAGQAA